MQTAFQSAREADPNAELYYNDYGLTDPEKRAGVIKMISELRAIGAKIDGVGIQAHWLLNSPSVEEIENAIVDLSGLGIKIMITELDIDVLPRPKGKEISEQRFINDDPQLNPYIESLPDSMQIALAERYHEIFRVFIKHQDKIDRVTFWGVHDGQSWLNNFRIRGRTNYPLLFDRQYLPKPAFHSIMAMPPH